MSLAAHLDSLETKHIKLKALVAEESSRPMPDFTIIQSLKKQKLLIKEELQRLTDQSDTLRHQDGAA